MANTARKRNWQTDKTRAKIKTAQLLNRLQAFCLGKKDPQTKQPVKLSNSEVKAIQVLLSKTLPDLSESAVLAMVEQTKPEATYEENKEALIKSYGLNFAELMVEDIDMEMFLQREAKDRGYALVKLTTEPAEQREKAKTSHHLH